MCSITILKLLFSPSNACSLCKPPLRPPSDAKRTPLKPPLKPPLYACSMNSGRGAKRRRPNGKPRS